MTVRFSTGLRDAHAKSLTANPGAAILPAFFINYYSGSQPATADAAFTGTLLATFAASVDGLTPCAWEDAADVTGGKLEKLSTQTWQESEAIATGTAGWGRIYVSGDTNALSTAAKRIDFSITTIGGGGDVEISSTSIVASAPQTLSQFDLTYPV